MSIRINGVDSPSQLDTPSVNPHGTYHLADNPNLYEVQRSNNFEFIIPQISDITGNSADVEMLRLSVMGATIPRFSQNAIEIKRGNNIVKAAGTPTFDSGTVTIRDFIGTNVKNILWKWQNKSYNVETEKVGLMSDYKIDAYLLEYTPDYQLVRQWKLHGCWVSSISEDAYSYDSDHSSRSMQVTIIYDRGEIDTSDVLED